MQLSDAIRLGAMIRPQGFEDLFPRGGTSCALGAAYEAGGMMTPETLSRDAAAAERVAAARWPMINYSHGLACPVCGSFADYCTGSTITHLNDDHRWTREAIADWVASVEPAVVTPTLEIVAV